MKPSPPNTLTYYGGAMVELHHALSVANSYHKQPAGIFKQCWLDFYRSMLHTVTASCENLQDNPTILAMPGQFCHTICAIPPVYNTVPMALQQSS